MARNTRALNGSYNQHTLLQVQRRRGLACCAARARRGATGSLRSQEHKFRVSRRLRRNSAAAAPVPAPISGAGEKNKMVRFFPFVFFVFVCGRLVYFVFVCEKGDDGWTINT